MTQNRFTRRSHPGDPRKRTAKVFASAPQDPRARFKKGRSRAKLAADDSQSSEVGGDHLPKSSGRFTYAEYMESRRTGKEAKAAIRDAAMIVSEARSRGRPPDYHEVLCDLAYSFSLLGATNTQLAEGLCISPATLDLWYVQHPNFLSSVTRGKRVANAKVAQGLYNRGAGFEREAVKVFCHEGTPVYAPYTEYYPPDPGAAMNFLKNREPELWRDRRELTGRDGAPLIPPAGEVIEDLVTILDRVASRLGSEPGRANGHDRTNGAAGHPRTVPD